MGSEIWQINPKTATKHNSIPLEIPQLSSKATTIRLNEIFNPLMHDVPKWSNTL